ncbi:MAG: hypothetical protein LBT27_02460 [Prevotellaceae bacterium]|jgi:hypothetical protein|nr:hypothetical protein [Prevotellaceae bacterium]
MKQTFNYKEKFAFSYCYPAIAFVALAILAQVLKYGIAIQNFSLLEYPNSVYILIVCAVIFIAYAYYKYNSAKKSANNPNPIEITETSLSFPKGESEKISVDFANINELYAKNDEDEGKQVIIYTNDKNRYEFSEDRFENAAEFAKFESLVKQYSVNITSN